MEHIYLKQQVGSPWEYNSTEDQYELRLGGVIVAIVDSNGNIKISGRFLKFE